MHAGSQAVGDRLEAGCSSRMCSGSKWCLNWKVWAGWVSEVSRLANFCLLYLKLNLVSLLAQYRATTEGPCIEITITWTGGSGFEEVVSPRL